MLGTGIGYNRCMEYFGLDAILLFVLSVPVVMRYRILPVSGTPYWLFGVLFFMLLCNVLISLYPHRMGTHKYVTRIKTALLGCALMIVVGGTMITSIIDRAKTAPVYGVHDIILQQEAAMRYLLEGKNPYKETYFGTPLEQWQYDELGKPAVNPALYHFVMPPWYLLFPFVFYFFSIPLWGFFDGRMVLVFAMAGLLLTVFRWFRNTHIRFLAMILIALSPGVIDYVIEGRSDVFVLFWFVGSLFLLEKRRFALSAVLCAFALMSKQTAWFSIPFIGAYIWAVSKRSWKTLLRYMCITSAVSALILSPFLWWDANAFINSVIFYLSGNTAHSYPISGYGLGMIFYSLGIVKNIHDSYPFIIWQIAIGLPIYVVCIRWLTREPKMSRLLIGYTTVLFVLWYLGRYFNNSHLGFIGSLYVLGVLKHWDEFFGHAV